MSSFKYVLYVYGFFYELSNGDVTLGRNAPTLSEWLWTETSALRQVTLNTAFIQGIKNGNLDVKEYGAYMIQDIVYTREAGITWGIAANRSTAPEDTSIKTLTLSRQKDKERSVRTLKQTWHIRDLNAIEYGPAGQNYSNYERHVAEKLNPIYTVVANIPCEKMWPWMARQITYYATPNNVYSFWINDNKDNAAHKDLESLLDKYDLVTPVDRNEALRVYTGSLHRETNFFNSATN